MEIKKSDKANLENKKLLFFEIGMIVALGLVWGALEWTSSKSSVDDLQNTLEVEAEEEMINIEDQTPPEPEPEPQPQQQVILSETLEIVEDDVVTEDVSLDTEEDGKGVQIVDYKAAVQEEEVEEEAIPFQLVEKAPSFKGGDANTFSKWVATQLVYPDIAKENGIQGRVIVQFTVEKDGRVTNVKILRGVDPTLDKEAVRVINSSPKWEPGRQRDRTVKVTYTFPVIFQLR